MSSRWMGIGLLAAMLWGASPAIAASDYERELKWADEIKAGLVVGEPIELRTSMSRYPFLSLFTPGDPTRAVILAHGLGVHPDWGLIGALRVALNERGFTTLSLQMPILPIEASPDAYGALAPEGAARIARAVSFLEGQGYAKISLITHSLGSRMGLLYMSNKPNSIVRSWTSLGSPDFGYPDVKIPVLDVYGELDYSNVLKNAKQRAKSFKNKASKQVRLEGSDHFYEGRDAELIDTVAGFVEKVIGKASLPVIEVPAEVEPTAASGEPNADKAGADEAAPAAPAAARPDTPPAH